MTRPDRESRRMLLEALATVREQRMYCQPKAGEVHRVKVALRCAGIPVPLPRSVKVEWHASEDELFASVQRRLARLGELAAATVQPRKA